jgi:hypothetical protein
MPLTLDLRWYHEFSAENRLEGDGIFLTASMPLRIRPPRDSATDWTGDAQQQGELDR